MRLVATTMLVVSAPALATVYYVDTNVGNDSWSGMLPAALGSPANNGPWRTLARVSAASFQPGDEVRLHCGHKWNETLRINQSGIDGNPIRIGGYPEPCTTQPLIDGSLTIPADNWVRDHGSVYRAQIPVNLLTNGVLRTSTAHWSKLATSDPGAVAFSKTCPGVTGGCLSYLTPKKAKGLVISPKFAVQAGAEYEVRYSILIPKGVNIVTRIRRAGPTDLTNLAPITTTRGTGKWMTKSALFKARYSAPKARLDFETPGKGLKVYIRDVAVKPQTAAPVIVLLAGRKLQLAHHPNFGFDEEAADSVYLKNAADSDLIEINGASGSTYLTTGDDLKLPPGVAIEAGLSVSMRTENWNVDQRVITGVAGDRVNFLPQTRYQFRTDWGYFFQGAKWMVDSPDEWYFDVGTSILTVWMPDGANPSGKLAFSSLNVGIDLSGQRDIVVENIRVRAVGTGVEMNNAQRIVLRRLRIEDIKGVGVKHTLAKGIRLEESVISRTGQDAISGCDTWNVRCSVDSAAADNLVVDSGLHRLGSKVVSLPTSLYGAINVGRNGTVTGNRIVRAGTFGIFTLGASTISRNSITEACLTFDDCAGIYSSLNSNNSVFSNNLVNKVSGNTLGNPFAETRSVGIYIDEQAQNILAEDNVVVGADNGIHVHNAFNNTLRRNVLYGNRRSQIWLQEQSNSVRSNGDIFGNSILHNVMVPVDGGTSVLHTTSVADTTDFANYSANIYSTLISPRIVGEKWPDGVATYTLPHWQSATASGVPRNSDIGGRAVAVTGYTAFRSVGGNLVPNGSLESGSRGWHGWNSTAPLSRLTVETCGATPCLKLVAGATTSLLASPNFSVNEGRWYRVSFDASTQTNGQLITVVPRRGGGGDQGFESLLSGIPTFTGSTALTRYSFVFQSTRTVLAGDPTNGEMGARIDFQDVEAFKTFYVANVEMVPLAPVDIALKTAILLNPYPAAPADVPCPDAQLSPATCAKYVTFLETVPVTWPYRLGPLGREVIYTRDPTLLDSDNDTVANSQDQCANTASGNSVNAKGCGLDQ